MARVQRVLPSWHVGDQAGPHIFGDIAVNFDAEGFAEVVDAAVLEMMRTFPETFHLVNPLQEPTIPVESSGLAGHQHLRAQTLEGMTLAELRHLAVARGLADNPHWRRRDVIDALLALRAER